MKILEILKNKKLFFFQIFLTLYIAINLVGGDRGLVSYFEKKNYRGGPSRPCRSRGRRSA